MKPLTTAFLDLARCPHCRRAKPTIPRVYLHNDLSEFGTSRVTRWHQREIDQPPGDVARARFANNYKNWGLYQCSVCGRLILAEYIEVGYGSDKDHDAYLVNLWPTIPTVPSEVPPKMGRFLEDAMQSAPSAAIMATCSALDSMLKEMGYKNRKHSLEKRIDRAAADHLITEGMKHWAHEIRLDANAQRHADDDAEPATREDADRVLEFALALAEYLYVLPARVQRGRGQKNETDKSAPPAKPTVNEARLAAAMAVKSK